MRILHVLSQVFMSGPEFYVAALAERLAAEGHEILVVSDTLTARVKGELLSRPIADRTYPRRIRNVLFLRRLIRERGIDVVHAHSRAASWVSYFATRGSAVPLVSTVHGRQFPHASARLFDVYGDRVIAVCENLREHLVNEMGMKRMKISLIRNGVEFPVAETGGVADGRDVAGRRPAGAGGCRGAAQGGIVAIVGRTNGPKGETTVRMVENVVRPLLARRPGLRARIIGGDVRELPGDGPARVMRAMEESGGRIETPGFVSDLRGALSASDLVIGAGRVAVEAVYLGRHVLAVGEDVCPGLITPANLEAAMASNFGDILPESRRIQPDYGLLLSQAAAALDSEGPEPSLRSRVVREYDAAAVSGRVLGLYESARMQKRHPRHIPVLMYHKIPDEAFETRHRVFITRSRFRRHLELFKRRGLSPITFKEYREFSRGERDIRDFPSRPVILTFDDGYRDNYANLLPMMREFGFKGVLFLLGDPAALYNFWDADRGDHYDPLMSLEEKRGFAREGWEIGAHSMTHPDLTAMDDAQALWEIGESKRRLEADLDTDVVSFAYPGGSADGRVERLVREAGLSFGVATDTGGLHIEDNRHRVFRVNVFPGDGWFQIWKKSSSWYRRYYRWKRGK